MRVCDRCKKELGSNVKESKLAGKEVELCLDCAEYILNHIQNYKTKKAGIGNLFKWKKKNRKNKEILF